MPVLAKVGETQLYKIEDDVIQTIWRTHLMKWQVIEIVFDLLRFVIGSIQ